MSKLSVTLGRHAITIRLPLKVLKVAAENAPFIHHVDYDTASGGFEITDRAAFAREVVAVLEDEAEDGATLVQEMLDDAMERVVDQGGEGFRWLNARLRGD